MQEQSKAVAAYDLLRPMLGFGVALSVPALPAELKRGRQEKS